MVAKTTPWSKSKRRRIITPATSVTWNSSAEGPPIRSRNRAQLMVVDRMAPNSFAYAWDVRHKGGNGLAAFFFPRSEAYYEIDSLTFSNIFH